MENENGLEKPESTEQHQELPEKDLGLSQEGITAMQGQETAETTNLEEIELEIADKQNYFEELANYRAEMTKKGIDEEVKNTTQEMDRIQKSLYTLTQKKHGIVP